MLNLFKKKINSADINNNQINQINQIIYEEPFGDYKILKCKVSDLQTKFINWSKNRSECTVRVDDIYKYYLAKNIKLVPGIIHAWKNQNGEYEIFDGIHRLLAAVSVKHTNGNDMTLLLQIHTSSEQEIIEYFKNINKSVSIPYIYTEETSILKKNVVEYVVNELCTKYKSFISPSRNCFVYNFNRDVIIDFFSTLELDFTKPKIEIDIFNELIGLNGYAKNFVKEKNIDHPKKCDYYNFYLWYLEKSYIKNKIEMYVK